MNYSALAFLLTVVISSVIQAREPAIRVVVWDEQQPAQKQAYENFLGNAIAEHLTKQPGLRVISANLSQPDKGLHSTLLDNTDVLVWWGHVRHDEISPEVSRDIVARIKEGRPPGLRQPAAALVQAACCQTTGTTGVGDLAVCSTAGCGTESCSRQQQSKVREGST